tara:strand:+ start:499 stop:996 length:498 start_codon:yes stop_codon:yes gene_type:complete
MSLSFDNQNFNNILNEINSNKDVDKDNVCAICRDNLLVDTIDLHCNHRYHTECLLNSFVKYDAKKCPLCNEHFIIESYKTKCSRKMTNGNICNKTCYNNEQLCKTHIKSYLKELEKEATKKNKTEISRIKKEIKKKNTKLKKLSKDIKDVMSEIQNLESILERIK